jgi:hypothetical protein
MPKRSNDFQKLIKVIYDQLAPKGATITEPALLYETSSGKEREVDILIEFKAIDVQWRMCVECRKRSRSNSVEWIDSLIGKYHDLAVDRIIAVSDKPFTEAAVEKASARRIKLITLEKAIETNWNDEFGRLIFARTVRNERVREVQVDSDRPFTSKLLHEDTILDERDQHVSSWGDYVKTIYDRYYDTLSKAMHDAWTEQLAKDIDTTGRTLTTVVKYRPPVKRFVQKSDGQKYPIIEVRLLVSSTLQVTQIPMQHFEFGTARVYHHENFVGSESSPMQLTAVQEWTDDRNVVVKVQTSPKKSASKSAKKTTKKASKRKK